MNAFMKKYFFIVIIFVFAYVFSAAAQESTLQTAENYFLYPGNEITLPPNGRVALTIKQAPSNKQVSLGHWLPVKANTVTTAQWTIDGKDFTNQNAEEGSFKLAGLQFQAGVYAAPAKVPPHNPVVITVSFQPEGQKAKVNLYCRIHIIDKKNYFYLSDNNSAGGTLYEVNESLMSAMPEDAYYEQGQWDVMVHGIRKLKSNKNPLQNFMSIDVGIDGNGKGTYPWTVKWNEKQGAIPPYNSVGVGGIGKDGTPFEDGSVDCRPHGSDKCKPVALEGSTTVTVFDKQKEIMKGYFSGILVTNTGQYVSVSGAFSVKM